MLLRNTSNQGIFLFAKVLSTGLGATSDAANITGARSLDGVDTPGFATAHPIEMSGGRYWQPLAQAETNGDAYSYGWTSTTPGVVIEPVSGLTELAFDGTIAAATSSTLTLPSTDSRGVTIPDDGRYVNSQLRIVGDGTGAGQVPILTTATGSPRQYNLKAGSCPVQLDATSQFQFAGTITARLDLTQAVPRSNTAETVGDSLNAARTDAFGPWAITGTTAPYTVTMYAADGITVVHAFQIDSLTAPMSRT